MAAVGMKAPDFTLRGVYQGHIEDYSLRTYQGNWLVLFFYPADFTFICPTEVTGFSKMAREFHSEKEPYLAAEGLLKALSQEGLKKEQSYRIVKLLSQEERVFLRTLQEKVFGLGTAETNRPLQAALVMGVSFVVGAIIPLLPYLILAGIEALYLSIVLAAATLFSVGVFKGYLAARSLFLSGLEFFFIAVGAAILGYLIGLVVQYFFPGIAIPAG